MKYLIVLDINGTLCCRIKKRERKLVNSNPFAPAYSTMINGAWIYLRPFLNEFIKDLNFAQVGLWSSMTEPNTHLFHKVALQGLNPLFTFDRSHCSNVKEGKNHESTKDLSTIYSIFPEFSADNTIMIDDSVDKFVNLENILLIPEYSVIDGDSSQDQGILSL